MEKIHRRIDGVTEVAQGLLAVVMLKSSGMEDDSSWFRFKPCMTCEPITVRWQAGSDVGLFEPSVATGMVRLSHARWLLADEVEMYNAEVDKIVSAFDAETGANIGDPTPPADTPEHGKEAAPETPPPAPVASEGTPAPATEAKTPETAPAPAPVAQPADPNKPVDAGAGTPANEPAPVVTETPAPAETVVTTPQPEKTESSITKPVEQAAVKNDAQSAVDAIVKGKKK